MVITGFNEQLKINTILKKVSEEAKENIFEDYILIYNNPMYLEEALMKYTDSYVNITILTFEQFFHYILERNGKHIQKLNTNDAILFLENLYVNSEYHLFPNHISNISSLLSLFKELPYSTSLPENNLSALYQKVLSSLDDNECLTYFEKAKDYLIKDHHIYCLDDTHYYASVVSYFKKLSSDNEVVLCSYSEDDARILNYDYSLFDVHDFCEFDESYNNIVSKNLFTPSLDHFNVKHPYHLITGESPKIEIAEVLSDFIRRYPKDSNLQHYAFFMPDDYHKLFTKYLDDLNLVYNKHKNPYYRYLYALRDIVAYWLNNKDDDLLSSLSTGVYEDISDEDILNMKKYHALGLSIINKYCRTIKGTTYLEIVHEVSFFMHANWKNEDGLAEFIASLSSNKDCAMTLELFFEYINGLPSYAPVISTNDMLHIYSYNDASVLLSDAKYIYMLGFNEGVVPSKTQDTGLLLNKERKESGLFTTIEKLANEHKNLLKVISSNVDAMTFSYATVDLSCNDILPSTTLLQIISLFNIKENKKFIAGMEIFDDILSNNVIDQDVLKIANEYKESKNQPLETLNTPLFNKTLSVSQLETYNKCPYKYFLQYILHIDEINQYNLVREIGLLRHEVLDQLHDYITGNDIDLKTKVKDVMEEYIKNKDLTDKMSLPVNRYFYDLLQKDIINIFYVLRYQYKEGLYTLEDTEKRIFSDFHSFEMKGFIDRLDVKDDYMKVIDYKSSDKNTNLDLMCKGFNMQMWIYLDMLIKETNKKIGGLLYFNTSNKAISKKNINDEIEPIDYISLYKLNGYIEENQAVNIDYNMDGSSNIVSGIRLNKNGSYGGNSLLTADKFNEIITAVEETCENLYTQMNTREIPILPSGSYDPNIRKQVNPCTYCPYSSICQYDKYINSFREVIVDDQSTQKGSDTND